MRRSLCALLILALALCAAVQAETVELAPIVSMEVVNLADPTPSPTPYVAPTATPAPGVAATPVPVVTATPTPYVAPTATPASAEAPVATDAPELTGAPAAEATPSPTPYVAPTATPMFGGAAPIAPPPEREEAEPGVLMRDVQPETTLSVGGIFGAAASVLGSGIPRTMITSVRFESSAKDAPAEAWDASAAQDGSVLAWVGDAGDLTIASEGGVRANPDSSELFAGYSSATTIDFNDSFDTSAATDMSHMFESCWSLTSLDASALDTSNVTDMSYMFSTCPELASLDVSGFDTGRSVNMEGMFLLDAKLEELDVSGFDTRNVTSLRSMFEGCSGLKFLDLTNFRTANASDMRWMFSGCSALERVGLGTGFVLPADATGIFEDCAARVRIGTRELSSSEWANLGSYAGLKKWSKGDVVRWLQEKLNAAGFDAGSVDGVFGPATEAALTAWQTANGFEASGMTDMTQVWQLLK